MPPRADRDLTPTERRGDGFPFALAGPGGAVSALETHTAAILLTGTTVLKIKKPVRFAFLDFTTRERRLAACEREVALNRRLAPDVYLGVADIAGPDGRPWEHAVVMRRLPAERSLDRLIADDRLPAATTGLLAEQLATFHASARRGPDIDQACTIEAVLALWDENLAELAPITVDPDDRRRLTRIGVVAHAYLAGRGALWAERLAAGVACDGHGDLQAADIFCLDDGPRILDCIEFDDRYRYGDVVADLAFLVMDLERLGADGVARELVDRYAEASGGSWPTSLLDHQVAYRALVRAKVAALRAAQETTEDLAATTSRRLHRQLLGLCLDHLERAQVLLVLVGGAPGTGKTTLADALVDRMRSDGREVRAVHSDVIRKELAGLPPVGQPAVALDSGLYRPVHTEATYGSMLAQAGEHLERGISVVLDASWSSADRREGARALGRERHAVVVEVACHLDPETAGRRIRARAARGDASDATPDLARVLASRAEPWPEADGVTTLGSPVEVADRVWKRLVDRTSSARPASDLT